MGYNTSYSLEVINGNGSEIEQLREECEEARFALEQEGSPCESCKWYDHETDLNAFSKKYPECVFVLHGEGKENGDLWRRYFKNGRSVRVEAIITYPEVDINKL